MESSLNGVAWLALRYLVKNKSAVLIPHRDMHYFAMSGSLQELGNVAPLLKLVDEHCTLQFLGDRWRLTTCESPQFTVIHKSLLKEEEMSKPITVKRRTAAKMITVITYNPRKQEYLLLPMHKASLEDIQKSVASQYSVAEMAAVHIVTVLEGLCVASEVYEAAVEVSPVTQSE